MHKTTLFNFILFILLLPLVSCRVDRDDKNTLRFPLTESISTIDPVNAYDSVSMSVIYQGYEQLFEYHYLRKPLKLVPLLAEEMPQVSDDGLTYTIKVKEGVQYHDHPAFNGQPRYVEAQDFINQIKRLAFTPYRSNGWWLFDGRVVGLNKFRKEVGSDFEKLLSTNVDGLKALDKRTLQIRLIAPYPQMLNALAMSFTSPMPAEVMKKETFLDELIGTGPYKLDKWFRGSKLFMSRFNNYHKSFYPGKGDRFAHSKNLLTDAGKRVPFIDKIEFHIIKEAQTRWLQFMSGKLDFLRVPKDNYHSLVSPSGELTEEFRDKKITLDIFSSFTYWWFSFNMKDPIVGTNKNLRLAIAHAVNVEKYIKTFTNNIGLKANSIYPPGIPGYDPSRKLPYSYNIEKAKEYLRKAGYPDGKGLPTLVYDTRASSTTQRQRAELLKQDLEAIGIKMKIQLNTFPAFLKKSKEGKLQIWLDGWTLDYPDSENVLQLLTTKNQAPGPNVSNYSNADFDKKFESIKVMNDSDEKYLLMSQVEDIVLEDLPWVLLYYSRDYIVYHNRLKNFRYNDLVVNKVKYLRLK
ncbi:ABC transporter substrate-binding protein [Halobacteriovorax sp. HFRX-2_2]|uniref:ABC transporter substrate-binding protein n=1 Tax=unclassified Halobacteriovorax TaxID=2639665 RepID=UPI00370FC5BE